MAKVFLLNPPTSNGRYTRDGRCTQSGGTWSTTWPPISLATIGACLQKDKHSVVALDAPGARVGLEEALRKIKNFGPEYLVCATGSPTINEDLAVIDAINEINPEIKILVIGTHVTILAEEILYKHPSIYCIIHGEPEYAIQEVIKNNNRNISGISYLDKSEYITKKRDEWINVLDHLPFPSWDLFDLENYRLPLKGEKFVILAPSRGCPWNCTFCTASIYYGKELRHRSIANIVEEVIFVREKFKITNFFIWSDTFTADKKFVLSFCESIKYLNISWVCNSRVDTFDEEIACAMKKSGCWMISFGIESGNQNILDLAQKGISIDQVEKSVNIAKKYRLAVAGHFIIGLLGETKETIEQTIAFSTRLNLDIAQFYCASPFPGTQIYKEVTEKKLLIEREYSQDVPGILSSEYTETELLKYKKKAYYTFYLRIKVVVFIIKTINYRYILRTLITSVRFLYWIKVKKNESKY